MHTQQHNRRRRSNTSSNRRSMGSDESGVMSTLNDQSIVTSSKKPDVETTMSSATNQKHRWSNPSPKTFQPVDVEGYENLKKPSSPPFFPIDGFTSAAFRPHVFRGPSDPSAGILGFQARSADGLDENFALPEGPSFLPQQKPQILPPTPSVDLKKHYFPLQKPLIPHLPAEIHLQILSGILDDNDSDNNCSFCKIFRLSSLSLVSPFYRDICQSTLFTNLDLTCHTGSCQEHHRLSSPHAQLTQRLPALLRTLSSSPDLAAQIRTIALPTTPFLTCEIEKTMLPLLLQSAPNVTRITGLDSLLHRQFFSGEHYCLDGEDPQQHGIVAKTLTTTTTSLTGWTWNGGNAAGRDFEQRLWDYNPTMQGIGFVRLHRNWTRLVEFALRDVWGVDPGMLADLLAGFPVLEKVELVKVRRRRVGDTDVDVVMAGLEAVWMGLREVTIGGVKKHEFMDALVEWVAQRGVTKVALRDVVDAERIFEVCGGVVEEVEIVGDWKEEKEKDVDMEGLRPFGDGSWVVVEKSVNELRRRRRMWRRGRNGWKEVR
ncbi:hypothetical protein EX30DRAFT_350873 [Ascodesmis nigricans]|uniref:F-box domain-containing protein n=1 Tax=Ascodesmis nigricans TaxID=341454 RepID=A0A4S2MNL1_9PEZI|nr:hypothetical protein EX30DRAFT_350873 [Ascodesmis nigricans]